MTITINTLLGGAFLLEVDTTTKVIELKDMLTQMQVCTSSMQQYMLVVYSPM